MTSNLTIAEELSNLATASGARLKKKGFVDLLTISRRQLTWFGKGVMAKMGVPKKPDAGSTCPACQASKQSFQLDHMGPWRVYVASAAGPHVTLTSGGELEIGLDVLKLLYNDPQNLWWICSDCNNKKSDKTYDSAEQLAALESGVIPDGEKGVDPLKVV